MLTKRLFSNYCKNKAIALSPPINPIAYSINTKQRSPLNTHKPDRLNLKSNNDRLANLY
ncbi:hypothetical protein VB774_16240 [Pseudanabaena galeata UHCC 0370]|uniref:Uncharacterized protein n=1 Tax=Pseudanabaena galeata UHCC 0370 TaxID=3110310 RepID=A0ABU5TM51_9CYAN|nr:hypothetical protein [Pseudanabaena galeata]MEA5479172.1 hypothetical protein [Pseudanabaena galeata UHCC 0370]